MKSWRGAHPLGRSVPGGGQPAARHTTQLGLFKKKFMVAAWDLSKFTLGTPGLITRLSTDSISLSPLIETSIW